MTIARSRIIDLGLTQWYHCFSKCVRGASLLRFVGGWRKRWLERRLKFLSGVFAIGVSGYAIMDNHLHVLLRVCVEQVAGWTDELVVRRWASLCAPRDARRQVIELTEEALWEQVNRSGWVAELRERLVSLSWFMKFLKEPLSRMANRDDETEGAFWQGRFKSIAVLDEVSLLKTQAYIDLNPFAAGMAERPEESPFTSLQTRINCCRDEGMLEELGKACQGSVAALQRIGAVEDRGWLLPMNDRRGSDGERLGVLSGYTLGAYIVLIDEVSRMFREGKKRLSDSAGHIFERLDVNCDAWVNSFLEMFHGSRLYGVAFANDAEKLRASAERRGCRRPVNLRTNRRKFTKLDSFE